MRKENPSRQRELWSRPIELHIVITNGDSTFDTKLKFEFNPEPTGIARVWLLKLQPLKNPDAFPQRLADGQWELRLDAVGDTHPLAVLNYTQESVSQWPTNIFEGEEPATTELLILAHDEEFTISIHQPSKGQG